MDITRSELQAFVRACEYLLSVTIDPPFTKEERDVVLYYLTELSHKYAESPFEPSHRIPPAA